ncbi:hypothetical protein HN51_009804 [Arachis hypogaea]|uniref:transcription factor TGA2.3-like isoform X2 n=2 Tax=Arachis hypogaea TaxID=3818 RepID=UPI000DECDE53|nr:transcription factor TGA9-like isoform X2 [Arachis hypogaea]XP_025683679.1 transcription factor TGA9-like isoform X2 [Arachis hypogaea]QHO55214.1 TGACG-sequence-specific DNA-binding protein TGA-2 [Arachis hypogaea]
MASQRIGGDTGLSESLITSHHHASTHGVLHGINSPSSTLMNEGGAFDFGELEEAIVLQGIKTRNDEEAKASSLFITGRPAATLEMFPSWPIRFHQTSRGGCKSGGWDENTDSGSGSGVNTNTLSSKLETEPHHNHFESQDSPISSQQQEDQEVQLATSDASRKGPSPQQKKKGASSTSEKAVDAKTLRRLAQNREAARKSRLRKKAYVQQLECSRLKLTQLEKEVERARSQVSGTGGGGGGGAMMFDMEYGRWLEDEERQMGEVRRGLEGGISDGEMRVIVESYMSHYDELFRLKAEGAKWDVFHIMNGTWTSPAERCFLWMGGFRPSDLVGLLIHQLEPLAEQQIIAMYGLRHSSQQAEDALSQGLEQLHHSLLHTISLPQMLSAMAKLSNLEAFLLQADHLRQQTLHQFCRFLTIRQAARCFLVIGDYYARLRALSSLWASRTLINNHHDNSSIDLQTQNHFSNF